MAVSDERPYGRFKYSTHNQEDSYLYFERILSVGEMTASKGQIYEDLREIKLSIYPNLSGI